PDIPQARIRAAAGHIRAVGARTPAEGRRRAAVVVAGDSPARPTLTDPGTAAAGDSRRVADSRRGSPAPDWAHPARRRPAAACNRVDRRPALALPRAFRSTGPVPARPVSA